MLPAVMQTLLGRTFDSEAATIEGFSRYGIVGKRYPGIVRSESGLIQGRIYYNLDSRSFDILDLFEGDFYERLTVKTRTSSRGSIEAKSYVMRDNSHDLLTGEPWSAAEFESLYLRDYIEMCERFRSDVLETTTQKA